MLQEATIRSQRTGLAEAMTSAPGDRGRDRFRLIRGCGPAASGRLRGWRGTMRSVEEDVRCEAALRVALPRPGAWAVAAFVLGVAGVLVYAGRPSIARKTTGSVVGDALTGEAPLVVLAGVLILTLWCLRRFLFARAARRPGAIEVLPFVDGTGQNCSFDAA